MLWSKRAGAFPDSPSFLPLAAAQLDPDFKDGFAHGTTGAEARLLDKSDRWVSGFEAGLRQLMSATPLLQ